jgi:hypothetical protein
MKQIVLCSVDHKERSYETGYIFNTGFDRFAGPVFLRCDTNPAAAGLYSYGPHSAVYFCSRVADGCRARKPSLVHTISYREHNKATKNVDSDCCSSHTHRGSSNHRTVQHAHSSPDSHQQLQSNPPGVPNSHVYPHINGGAVFTANNESLLFGKFHTS